MVCCREIVVAPTIVRVNRKKEGIAPSSILLCRPRRHKLLLTMIFCTAWWFIACNGEEALLHETVGGSDHRAPVFERGISGTTPEHNGRFVAGEAGLNGTSPDTVSPARGGRTLRIDVSVDGGVVRELVYYAGQDPVVVAMAFCEENLVAPLSQALSDCSDVLTAEIAKRREAIATDAVCNGCLSEQSQHRRRQEQHQAQSGTNDWVQMSLQVNGVQSMLQLVGSSTPEQGSVEFCGRPEFGLRVDMSGNCLTLVGGLLRHFSAFASPSEELDENPQTLPLPAVTIIGAQKAGTTNLRFHLLQHPLVTGMPAEVHFFDRHPSKYPSVSHWNGDATEAALTPDVVLYILFQYAVACLEEGSNLDSEKLQRILSGGITLDSCPKYLFSPIAPYRMKMVRPQAKLIVLLRDPTERYYSQLRMTMCREAEPGFSSPTEMIDLVFHSPGRAREYLRAAGNEYQPYGSLCRGEGATPVDLWDCGRMQEGHDPLSRGLYADQLERWLTVYDRSQMMVIDSDEIFADLNATLARVADFVGLPSFDFKYDPKHEFKGTCEEAGDGYGPEFFVVGGRYERMLEEENLLREWYKPHNERLFRLLGRDLGWNSETRGARVAKRTDDSAASAQRFMGTSFQLVDPVEESGVQNNAP